MTRVADLSGAELDYWVAVAGDIPVYDTRSNWPGNGVVFNESFEHPVITVGLTGKISIERCGQAGAYSPSTDWQDGGPIIHRERICLTGPGCMGGPDPERYWTAYIDTGSFPGIGAAGPTPLVAAMRAYVASKFGEEVPAAEAGN